MGRIGAVRRTGGVGRIGGPVVLVLAGVLAVGACGSPAPATPAAAPTSTVTVDPAVKPYCDTVAQVQAQQSAPGAGQGGLVAASADARRQIGSLVAVAPPEIAGDWRVLQGLTEQSLGLLAATGGDPARIDQRALAAIDQRAAPTVAHIKAVTQQRCGIAFSAAAPAPTPAPPTSSSTAPTTSSKSSRSRTTSSSHSSSTGSSG